MEQGKPMAFVIMPFSEEFEEVFEYIIAPPLEAAYELRLADSNTNQRNILADIVVGISQAYLVVADLTELNPNVMWELGVAHALGKRTLILTQDDPATLPFDLKNYRVLRYTTKKGRKADSDAQAIRRVGQSAISGAADFANPVIDFGIVPELSPSDPWDFGGNIRFEESEPGLLDLAADAETTQQRMTQHFVELAEITAWIGEQAERHTERMNQWKLRGSQGGMSKARELTNAAASDIFEYRRRIRDEITGIRRCGEVLRETWLPYLRAVPLDDPEDREENLMSLRSLGSAWQSAVESSKQAKKQVQSFRDTLEDLKGVSGRVNAAAGQASRQLNALIELMAANEALMEEMVEIIGQRECELAAD